MAHYAIAFDMDTKGMKSSGLTRSQITGVYQREIPDALSECGFTAHPQGSLYHTESDQSPITAIMTLQGILKAKAPTFCRYVRKVHVFRMEEWSDVTSLISERHSNEPLTSEDEFEQQEFIQESLLDEDGAAIPFDGK